LRRRVAARSERVITSRNVRQALVSLAGIIATPVRNQAGDDVGRLVDVVARVHGDERYPPVTGLVMRVGRRRAFLDAGAIQTVDHRGVTLRTSRLDLRDFRRRPGELMLARDLLDHQLVDVDGVQVIRAADLYLAPVGDRLRLVGVDVSVQSLLRRLGPKLLRGRPTPDRVIDWDAVQPFGDQLTSGPATVKLRMGNRGLPRLRPSELADLLEDLRRPARQELLASLEPELAADALEEMEPEELRALLRELAPEQAASLIAAMESDEAVDALRDLSENESQEVLEAMAPARARELSELLAYPEDAAGGFMSTTLVLVVDDQTAGQARDLLKQFVDHRSEIDAIVVVDSEGRLLDDLPLFELMIADERMRLDDVLAIGDHTESETVGPEANVREVAARLIDSRRSSVLVVDQDGRPLGRILADDIVDALTPDRGRLHFPRLLK
jgi:CBS domain-containing protein